MADGALLFDMNTNRHQTSRVEVTRLAFVPFVLNDTRVAFSSCLSGSLHFQAQTQSVVSTELPTGMQSTQHLYNISAVSSIVEYSYIGTTFSGD